MTSVELPSAATQRVACLKGKADPRGVWSLRVKASSVLCVQCSKLTHPRFILKKLKKDPLSFAKFPN